MTGSVAVGRPAAYLVGVIRPALGECLRTIAVPARSDHKKRSDGLVRELNISLGVSAAYLCWEGPMRMAMLVVALHIVGISPVSLSAQPAVADLRAELESGRVRLVSAVGNGNSSGAAVDGYLINQTASSRNIDVNIARPLYLANRGLGQNMVAVAVYLAGGAYRSSGGRSFITLPPRQRTAIFFNAYCVDFGKDNPSPGEEFTLGVLPSGLTPVLQNIAVYARRNPVEELMVSGQTAIWLAQGVSIGEIRTKFGVTARQEELARSFLASRSSHLSRIVSRGTLKGRENSIRKRTRFFIRLRLCECFPDPFPCVFAIGSEKA
jgi:hypothetical protein